MRVCSPKANGTAQVAGKIDEGLQSSPSFFKDRWGLLLGAGGVEGKQAEDW